MFDNQNVSSRPSRIILNFSHRCNMACNWCYIPFGDRPPDVETCQRVVARSAEIGMSVITFGGGDPFLYPFLDDLIYSAKRLGLFVHVDTNGIALRSTNTNARLLATGIDLLGLPLDGPDALVHGLMRSSPKHFQVLMDRLEWLLPYRHKTKLNTIVTTMNMNVMPNLARLVGRIRPTRWSLYQYWPLSDGIAAKAEHEIGNESFQAATATLADLPELAGIRTEVNPLPSRRLSYPFVNHEGSLYIHAADSLEEYQFLGSIFVDSTITTMFHRCSSERWEASSRYQPTSNSED